MISDFKSTEMYQSEYFVILDNHIIHLAFTSVFFFNLRSEFDSLTEMQAIPTV